MENFNVAKEGQWYAVKNWIHLILVTALSVYQPNALVMAAEQRKGGLTRQSEEICNERSQVTRGKFYSWLQSKDV